MTIPMGKAIAEFNERLLASACRMNRMPSGGIGNEIENAVKDLAEILEADLVVLNTFPPREGNWEAALIHPPDGPCLSIEKHFPSNLPLILNKIDKREVFF